MFWENLSKLFLLQQDFKDNKKKKGNNKEDQIQDEVDISSFWSVDIVSNFFTLITFLARCFDINFFSKHFLYSNDTILIMILLYKIFTD